MCTSFDIIIVFAAGQWTVEALCAVLTAPGQWTVEALSQQRANGITVCKTFGTINVLINIQYSSIVIVITVTQS